MNQDLIKKYIEIYGREIYSFCVYLTRSSEKADDLYQDTFLVAMEKGEIDENQNPKSYLITIAANLWKNQKRKYAVRNKKANIIYFQEENLEQLEDDSDSMEEQIIKKDEIQILRQLVDMLPDKLRIVILMYYMEEMSISDISEALHIPVGTVKSRMNQAKTRLKERMNKYEG
ncbi:MAG: RNA polymerase sigma factor [Lachnospiraceae bacterium]|nr:RNA polymerase sigma factor [Lachnospiraceae bacterium]